MDVLAHLLNRICEPLYHLTGIPYLDFILGTFSLAFFSAVLGQAAGALVGRINRRSLQGLHDEMAHFHGLSMEALQAQDTASYNAFNIAATDAYGKAFFNQAAPSAALLCFPLLALGWMQYRFSELEILLPFPVPLLGESVGFFSMFVLLYVLAMVFVRNLKGVIPLSWHS
jgi:hypothetical protein